MLSSGVRFGVGAAVKSSVRGLSRQNDKINFGGGCEVQLSKDFLKNLKYYLGYGPIFEKKLQTKGQKQVKIGVFGVLPSA